MKLHELHINNFKFFSVVEQDSPLLKIDGNHLLIYGENGSGKSTIYWGLYTLLESSLKKSDDEVRKYFKKIGKDSLVNLFATGRNDTEIKAILKSTVRPKTFRVSRKSRDMSIRSNTDVQESNMASDFINYRVLFQLHNLKHSKENDLWLWFYEEVLPYVKIGNTPCLETFEKLKKGPDKIRNLQGEEVFPTASLRKAPTIEERGYYQFYRDYVQAVKAWQNWFKSFISDINMKANELLNDEFDYDFKIELSFKQKTLKVTETGTNFDAPQILFLIPEYHGISNPNIKKPHTFLNEAKWSAIGLSIRFAILDIKLYTADLKALVIDDMLLSLDMRNRNIVLNLLLKKFTQDFQLILMSHDKSFFELAKKKINILGQGKKWKVFEMYHNDTGTFPKPYFKPEKSNVQKAKDFLIQHDYAACGIYLRKEIERKLTELLPVRLKKEEKTDEGVTRLIDKKLNDLILSLKEFCNEESIDYTPFEDLKVYKDLLLNPLAHNDVDSPFFRDELNKLIEISEELQKIKRGRFFYNSNSKMYFELTKPDGSYYFVRVYSAEQIVLLEKDGEPERISIYSKCKVSSIDNNGTIENTPEQFDTIKECVAKMCLNFGVAYPADLSRTFDYDSKTFDEKLLEINGT